MDQFIYSISSQRGEVTDYLMPLMIIIVKDYALGIDFSLPAERVIRLLDHIV